MDLDLRKLRYFAEVARLKHFGRAAEVLHIAQPVLSRQVRALEREIGCELVVTTTRSVELTDAGIQLLAEAETLLASVGSAVRRVLEIDRGVQRLVVAFTPGLRVSDAVRAFSLSRPEVQIDLMRLQWWEQDGPLRDGRADVGLLRRPFDDSDLQTIRVGSEQKLACLPAGHPLSGRPVLRVADLADEDMLDSKSPHVSSIEEKFELIAAGTGVAMVPVSVASAYPRADLVYIPVEDSEPVETCLVVRAGRQDSHLSDFLTIATPVLRSGRHLAIGTAS